MSEPEPFNMRFKNDPRVFIVKYVDPDTVSTTLIDYGAIAREKKQMSLQGLDDLLSDPKSMLILATPGDEEIVKSWPFPKYNNTNGGSGKRRTFRKHIKKLTQLKSKQKVRRSRRKR